MKLFEKIKKWLENQEYLFYLLLFILIVPNVALCFTEPMPLVAKVCNILFPFSCYYFLITLSRNCGKTIWILFPILFFGAFQIVLLYLFGQSIIAVDMFLNLATTNSSEALELLDNLIPALIIVIVLYIPLLILGIISIVHKRKLSLEFLRRERKKSFVALVIGVMSLAGAYLLDSRYEMKTDLYPVNVCYNIGLAFERNMRMHNYYKTSKNFSFHAKNTHPAEKREIYVMVVGETSRAFNWQLYGYGRETNPFLSKQAGLVAFSKTLTESNTTHKSVPMLLSDITANNYDSIYYQKSVITAFKEAGYHTAFFSNQRYNESFIDFFGKEADTYDFIKENSSHSGHDPFDSELLKYVKKELAKDTKKLFIVLHTYGSHFNYRERYPAEEAFFMPDHPVDAKRKFRDNLINAYDNSTRYTDHFLADLIHMLEEENADAAMIYTSDHGEDIFDDSRYLFLHSSPVPSYYQIHVPFILWMSESYRATYPTYWEAAVDNKDKDISSSSSFFSTMLNLAGIETTYCADSLSVVNAHYNMNQRLYLNDHNETVLLRDLGLKRLDYVLLDERGIRY